jgi:hypothetical protein
MAANIMKPLGYLPSAFLAIVAALAASAVMGCGQRPKLDVSATIVDDEVVFDIKHSGINQIADFQVSDETGLLWSVSALHGRGYRITYGVLPPRADDLYTEPEERFPLAGRAKHIRGKNVTVSIGYQYDDGFVPCAGHFNKSVQIPE